MRPMDRSRFHDLLDHSERDPLTGWSSRQAFDIALVFCVVLPGLRHSRKATDFPAWQGANRSSAPRHREDVQRGHGRKEAVLCAA
jgi:hypothetical protein